jgi:hypothetical protein
LGAIKIDFCPEIAAKLSLICFIHDGSSTSRKHRRQNRKKNLIFTDFLAKIMLKFGAKRSHSVRCEPKYKKYLKNRSKVAAVLHQAITSGVCILNANFGYFYCFKWYFSPDFCGLSRGGLL